MAFIRTRHLEFKLAVRLIPKEYPEIILTQSKRKFKNSLKDRQIFVANLFYHGKIRPMALVVELHEADFELLTVFPLTEREIIHRIKNKRWKPL